VADELETFRQLKARYCRFLDAKDADGWRSVFSDDVVVLLDMAVSTGGADPMTALPAEGPESRDNFVPMVLASLENVATMHHCHIPEITPASPVTATGIWAMEDWIIFGNGNELHGAGHYHETYEKQYGTWRIKTLHLTRTIQQITGDNA
jgi:hypothetical protein